jgi:hypothetical protein
MSARVVSLSREEAWLDKSQTAAALGCSVRFLEYRVKSGMPSSMRFGRRYFRLSEVEAWLERHGYIQEGTTP